jgi:hypothetical protein
LIESECLVPAGGGGARPEDLIGGGGSGPVFLAAARRAFLDGRLVAGVEEQHRNMQRARPKRIPMIYIISRGPNI